MPCKSTRTCFFGSPGRAGHDASLGRKPYIPLRAMLIAEMISVRGIVDAEVRDVPDNK